MIRSEFIQTMIIAPVVAFFDIKATTPKENNEICGNCKYYERSEGCKKHAPLLELRSYKSPNFPYETIQDRINRYPSMDKDDYCGDFKNQNT